MSIPSRRLAFVDRFVLEHVGNIAARSCLKLADVDQDGAVELVAGSLNGRLSVYKNRQKAPWLSLEGLGMISAIATGDIQNNGKTSVVVITADGSCRIFDYASADGGALKELSASGRRLPCSIVTAIISPFGSLSDRRNKLICATGTHDRAVYIYELHQQSKEGDVCYRLCKWEQKSRIVLPHMICDIYSTAPYASEGLFLVVGQRDDSFAIIDGDENVKIVRCVPRIADGTPESGAKKGSSTVHEDVLVAGMLPCEKTGKIYLSLLTTDGKVYLYDCKEHKVRVRIDLDAPIINATITEVFSDKHQKRRKQMIAALAYDGVTFLIDSTGDYIIFGGPDKTRAFMAGIYHCTPTSSEPHNPGPTYEGNTTTGMTGAPSLIYLTCDDRVAVYPNITIPFTNIRPFRDSLDSSLRTRLDRLLQSQSQPQSQATAQLVYTDWSLPSSSSS